MRKPEDKNSNNRADQPDNHPSEMGFPGVYGRFGDQPEETNLPQLSIVPGLIATILWVAVMLWLATLPGGPLHLPKKPTTIDSSHSVRD